jgi:WD40 repeat protein
MAQATLQSFLRELHENCNLLKEREAKYANAAPVYLLNQLRDYEIAIERTTQALEEGLSLDDLQAEFNTLNLELRDRIVFVSLEPPRQPFTGQNPYRGLEKFTESEADFFFGRTAAIESLLAMVQRLIETETGPDAPDLLAVLGASGSGKSSLVRAGLIPALRAGRLQHGPQGFHLVPPSESNGGQRYPKGISSTVDGHSSAAWPIRVLRPGPDPLESLAQTLAGLTGRGLPSLLADLQSGPKALHQLILESLADQPEEARLVLVIDQFEEVFTLCTDEAERRAFIDHLLVEAQHRRNRGLIILTMRADFYDKAAAYKALAEVITLNQMLVSPMTENELREAILRPAEVVGLKVEKDLAQALVQDTLGAPGALPLLQHALLELFHRKDGDLLTMKAYGQIGGVKGALAHRADSVLAGLTPEQQQVAQNIFLRLTALGEGVSDTRRRVSRAELYPAGVEAAQVEAVLAALTGEKARLVVADEQTAEVTHEALIQQWGTLRTWLEENREALRTQRRLTEAADEWAANERDHSYLYTGARLAEAEEWTQSHATDLTEVEQAFLSASVAEQEREAQERRKRTQRIIAGLAVGLVLIAIAAVFGFYGQSQAVQSAQTAEARRLEAEAAQGTAVASEATAIAERTEAERQAQIALAQSLAALALRTNNDDELTTLLALEALEIDRQVQGSNQWLIDSALREALAQPYFNTTLSGHENWVRSVAFSPDGAWLASGSGDGTIRLWPVNQPEAAPVVLSGHEDGVRSVTFSPDGAWLASGSNDRTVRLWPVNQPEAEPVLLSGHEDWVNSVVFSPDGAWLASGSRDGTVRLWQLSQPEAKPVVLSGHESSVYSVAFSPDGAWLASSSEDRTVRLWQVNQPQAEPVVLSGHESSVYSVAFSPDGAWLASGSLDQTVRLWPVSQPQAEPVVFSGHENYVTSVAFSPDGAWLASGSDDRTVRLWQVNQPQAEPVVLSGHEDWVNSVAFSPDGKWLASGSEDRTVRLWQVSQPEAEPVILSGHEAWVNSVAFSPKCASPPVGCGAWLASGNGDGTVRLWQVNQPEAEPVVLSRHGDWVDSVAFSSDTPQGTGGIWLASGSNDGTVRLWQVRRPRAEPVVLRGHEAGVLSVAFSPECASPPVGCGAWLASGSIDGTVRLWPVSQPQAEPVVLRGHESWVNSVAFSPDGAWLASGSHDRTVRLWQVSQPEAEPVVLRGHEDAVRSVAFSPDGAWLASGSHDRTVRLWQVNRSEAAPVVLSGHKNWVTSVAFSPDGAWLASGSSDGTIRLWQVSQPQAEPMVLRGHGDSVNSVAFSPNGTWLASGSGDGTVRLWLYQIDDLAEIGCRYVRRNLSQAEWDRYMPPGWAYHRTCPNWPVHPSVLAGQE